MLGLLWTLFGYFWWIWAYFAAIFFTLSVVTFLIPFFIQKVLPEQDLKKKYSAKWALITGGSSGIGLSIAKKLAGQGINLIIAAVKDDALNQAGMYYSRWVLRFYCSNWPSSFFDRLTVKQLQKEYPSIEVIQVGTDLSKDSCLDDIKAQTEKKEVQIVFCNAGYIKTGFFDDTTESQSSSKTFEASFRITSYVACRRYYEQLPLQCYKCHKNCSPLYQKNEACKLAWMRVFHFVPCWLYANSVFSNVRCDEGLPYGACPIDCPGSKGTGYRCGCLPPESREEQVL
jgi:hypothetical protein